MNLEQLTKKVEWLEGQKREADAQIKTLTRSVEKLEKAEAQYKADLDETSKKIANQEKETRKVEGISDELKEEKAETKKALNEIKAEHREGLNALEQSGKEERRKLEKDVLDLREEISQITVLKNRLKEQTEVGAQLDSRLDALEGSIKEIVDGEQAREELAYSLEENRKLNDQRISEALGTLDAVNDRLEIVNQIEIDQSKLAREFEKILEEHTQNKKAQREFIESQTGKSMELDRVWLKREESFASISRLSAEVDKRLEDLESIDIAVNRAQEQFNQLIEKIDRRVNELTEVQRLGEQHFRKEWTTFQADAQKRWTSQVLSQDELQIEANRQREKMAKQLTQLETRAIDIEERIEHLGDQNEQFLQGLLESVRSVLSENERHQNSLR